MASPQRNTWCDLFTYIPGTPTTPHGETVLPREILTMALLYTDPVATRYWGSVHPVIQLAESSPHYQQTWLTHHTNHTHLTYNQVVTSDFPSYAPSPTAWATELAECDLTTHPRIMELLNRRLDRVICDSPSEYYTGDLTELAKTLVYYLHALDSHYVLVSIYDYLSSESRTLIADNLWREMCTLPHRVPITIVKALHKLYKGHATNRIEYDEVYHFVRAVVMGTECTFPLSLETIGINMLCVYDDLEKYMPTHRCYCYITAYLYALRYHASKIWDYIYNYDYTGQQPEVWVDAAISPQHRLHLARGVTLKELCYSDKNVMAGVYQTRQWTDDELIDGVLEACDDEGEHGDDQCALMWLMRDRLPNLNINLADITHKFLYLATLYGRCPSSASFISLDPTGATLQTSPVPFNILTHDRTGLYQVLATPDNITITNGGCYLVITTQVDMLCPDLDHTWANDYVYVAPHSTLTLTGTFMATIILLGVVDRETMEKLVARLT